jgi:hypothetical protein
MLRLRAVDHDVAGRGVYILRWKRRTAESRRTDWNLTLRRAIGARTRVRQYARICGPIGPKYFPRSESITPVRPRMAAGDAFSEWA